MQDTFARARTRPNAHAMIGYLVYKVKCNVIYNNYPCLQHTYYVLVILISILPWILHSRLAMCNTIKWYKVALFLVLHNHDQ